MMRVHTDRRTGDGNGSSVIVTAVPMAVAAAMVIVEHAGSGT